MRLTALFAFTLVCTTHGYLLQTPSLRGTSVWVPDATAAAVTKVSEQPLITDHDEAQPAQPVAVEPSCGAIDARMWLARRRATRQAIQMAVAARPAAEARLQFGFLHHGPSSENDDAVVTRRGRRGSELNVANQLLEYDNYMATARAEEISRLCCNHWARATDEDAAVEDAARSLQELLVSDLSPRH
tara:strand:+ start:182 stop:742 length:561 start_codon:yes stop_codon:yes gene_type:complete